MKKKIKKIHRKPSPLPMVMQDVPLPDTHTQKKVVMSFTDRAEPGLFDFYIKYLPLDKDTGKGTYDPSSMAHVLARMAHEFLNIVLRQIPTDEKGQPIKTEEQAKESLEKAVLKVVGNA